MTTAPHTSTIDIEKMFRDTITILKKYGFLANTRFLNLDLLYCEFKELIINGIDGGEENTFVTIDIIKLIFPYQRGDLANEADSAMDRSEVYFAIERALIRAGYPDFAEGYIDRDLGEESSYEYDE